MELKLILDQQTRSRLAEAAVTERRPMNFMAEVLLRRAVGLPDLRWEPKENPEAGTSGSKGDRHEPTAVYP